MSLEFLKDPVRRKRLLSLIGALLVLAGGGTVVVSGGGEDPAPKVAPAPSEDAGPRERLSDLAGGLRDESALSAEAAAQNRRLGEARLRGVRGARVVGGEPSCRKDFSGKVWSSRGGQRPTEVVLHYTVSPNRAGWSDVLAIESFFSSARTASSHYIIDFEGNCLKMVHEKNKAWTQLGANPTSISIEIIAQGSESSGVWKGSPLFKRRILARKVAAIMQRWGLPRRQVNPAGCVFPPGWTDHFALECGNHHTDVRRRFPFRVFRRQLAAVW